tara:strand:+ start:241 stop:462 length:222 start_codon:yes stop_codon:yes gene_type:complete
MILGGVATPPFLCYNFSSVKYNMLSDALIEALRDVRGGLRVALAQAAKDGDIETINKITNLLTDVITLQERGT